MLYLDVPTSTVDYNSIGKFYQDIDIARQAERAYFDFVIGKPYYRSKHQDRKHVWIYGQIWSWIKKWTNRKINKLSRCKQLMDIFFKKKNKQKEGGHGEAQTAI